jgi:hypothetical protein
VIHEFAKVSMGLLSKGADGGVRAFSSAAKKLEVPVAGPDRDCYCPPRHRIPLNSRNEG